MPEEDGAVYPTPSFGRALFLNKSSSSFSWSCIAEYLDAGRFEDDDEDDEGLSVLRREDWDERSIEMRFEMAAWLDATGRGDCFGGIVFGNRDRSLKRVAREVMFYRQLSIVCIGLVELW